MVFGGAADNHLIDDSNAINIKLFPIYAPPPPVKAYHVPICTVQLELIMDVNWDLTMQKVALSRFLVTLATSTNTIVRLSPILMALTL